MKYILWSLAACCIFAGGEAVVSGSNRSSSRQSQNHPITNEGSGGDTDREDDCFA
jgi:hypothetical protein